MTTKNRTKYGMSSVASVEDDKLIIAENIAARLAELDKTKAWLSHEVDRTPSTMTGIFSGANCCSATLLKLMAEALDVSTDWLLTKHARRKSSKPQKNG
jgi:hypothetical protein